MLTTEIKSKITVHFFTITSWLINKSINDKEINFNNLVKHLAPATQLENWRISQNKQLHDITLGNCDIFIAFRSIFSFSDNREKSAG